MSSDLNLAAGEYISVLNEADGLKYECKIEKVDKETGELLIHWHGYSKNLNFRLEGGNNRIGPLKDANVPPPKPTRSRLDNQPLATGTNMDDSGSAMNRCSCCSGELMEDHLKCDECGLVTHLTCSGLPDYMLVRFLKSKVGFMCEPCVQEKWSLEKIAETKNRIGATKPKEIEAKQHVAELRHTKKTVVAPNSPNVTSICNRYRRGQCPHGKNGKKLVEGNKCNYAHPRKCRQYCNAGLDKKHGCRFGKKCKFLHPILCPSSSKRDGVCMGESCKLVHLKVKRCDNVGPEFRDQQNKVDAASIVGTQMKVGTVARSRGGNTNQEPVTATPSAAKNDQLERIEQSILSMQTKHDSEMKMLRQELVQIRGGLPMPWMGPQYPWMIPPNPASSLSHQVPLSYSPSLQHSSS